MGDPSSTRIVASANTLQDTRVKARPSLAESLSGGGKHGNYNKDSSVGGTAPVPVSSSGLSGGLSQPSPTPHQPTQSTTLFDEEYFKNNFIQDEIPEWADWSN